MRIAITGATGFLGGSLKEFLNFKNYTVLGISVKDDNFVSKISQFEPDVFIHCAWIGGSSYEDTQNQLNELSKDIKDAYLRKDYNLDAREMTLPTDDIVKDSIRQNIQR